jgi:hypothetical protein
MIDIKKILNILASERPIFHSEADFQHGLAWQIHLESPECLMRLEFKPPHFKERVYLDIWAAARDTNLAIELKYKTRGLIATVRKEAYNLLDQSAQDLARYDFLKDIQRVERIVSSADDVLGYAIFLTNDSAYWKPPINRRTIDADFRIHQGRTVTGELRWSPDASKGTMRGRENTILIEGVYNWNWQDYSQVSKASYGNFRYLLVRIEKT